jgi:WD40 repeat protein
MITTRAAMPVLIAALLSACGGSVSTSEPTFTARQSVSPAASTLAPTAGAPGRILLQRFPESGPPEKYVVNADGSDEEPFGPRVDYETRQVSADESLLSIVGPNSPGSLVGGTISVDGSGFLLFENPEPSLNLACGIWGPHDRMACEAWNDADPSLAGIRTVLASDGSEPQQLTTGSDIPCDYSPDGSKLAFVRENPDGNGSTLMVVASEGGEPAALLEDVAEAGLPCDWAPDGSSILTATTDGKLQLVTTEGDSAAFIGDGLDGYIFNGVWSSDGSRILVTMAFVGEQDDVYTIAADGSDLQRITDSELLEEGLTWLP